MGASADAQTWTFVNNTAVWAADGITLKGGNQYDENATAVNTGGVTFTGTSGFVSTALGIGFIATGSTTDENISIIVPAGYKATVTVYTSSNRTVKAAFGNAAEETYNASWAASTKEFNNATGTSDVALILYCNQNPGGSNQKQAPFLQSIVLTDMTTVSSYPWTATAVATIGGEKTTLKTYNSAADVDEGSNYTVVVDKVIEKDGVYYALNDDAFAANVYGVTYKMGNAAGSHEFNYEKVEDAVFYGEVEDIYTAGSNVNKATGSTVLSNGGGYSAMSSHGGYVTLSFNVPETAMYTLSLGMNNTNSSNRGFNYSIDGADVSETITVNANKPHVEEITGQTLKKGAHTITMNITYSLTPVFDYLLITKTGEPAKQTFTANFYDDNNWEHVYAYAFSTGDDMDEYFGEWPGQEITVKTDNKYTVTFEAAFAPTTIIFHNNSGTQTADLAFEDGGNYNLKGKLYTTTATFTTNLGWEHVYAYAWSGDGASKEEQLGGWAGRELTATDGIYMASIFSNTIPEFIIFHNNNGSQTSDLAFEDGKAYTWNSYTVYFTTDWTTVNAWAWNIVGEETENLCGSWPGTAMTGSDGTFTYTYTGVKAPDMILFNNGSDQTGDFTFEDGKTYTAAGPTSVDKTISAAGYATYCSPYALDFTGSNLTAYIAAKDADNNVTFSTITKVPANTGILLKGAAGNYAINTTTDAIETVANNALIGVTKKTVVNKKGIFVLMNGGQGVGFYKTTAESFTVGANTAYIDALPEPEGEGARTFIGFDFDNTTTAIEGVAAEKNFNGEIYNLQGQRVIKAQKGLYIINGKKVLFK